MHVSTIDDLTSILEEVYEMRLHQRPTVGLMQILGFIGFPGISWGNWSKRIRWHWLFLRTGQVFWSL